MTTDKFKKGKLYKTVDFTYLWPRATARYIGTTIACIPKGAIVLFIESDVGAGCCKVIWKDMIGWTAGALKEIDSTLLDD